MSSITPPKLGPLLQCSRKSQGMSLEFLSAQSGVSRSMLSQIERGEASPTFSTLWNIIQALGLTLADLTKDQPKSTLVEVVKEYYTPEITTPDTLCTLRILSPPEATGKTEWYLLLLQPGGELSSDAHAQGTREDLTVLDGRVEISADGQFAIVSEGETARYSAEVPHRIWNSGTQTARSILMVIHGLF